MKPAFTCFTQEYYGLNCSTGFYFILGVALKEPVQPWYRKEWKSPPPPCVPYVSALTHKRFQGTSGLEAQFCITPKGDI